MKTLDLLKLTDKQKFKGVWLSGIKGEGEYREWYIDGKIKTRSFWKNNKYHHKRRSSLSGLNRNPGKRRPLRSELDKFSWQTPFGIYLVCSYVEIASFY